MPDYKVKVTFEDYEYEENGGDAKRGSDDSFVIEDVGGPDAASEKARKECEFDIHHFRDVAYIRGR